MGVTSTTPITGSTIALPITTANLTQAIKGLHGGSENSQAFGSSIKKIELLDSNFGSTQAGGSHFLRDNPK